MWWCGRPFRRRKQRSHLVEVEAGVEVTLTQNPYRNSSTSLNGCRWNRCRHQPRWNWNDRTTDGRWIHPLDRPGWLITDRATTLGRSFLYQMFDTCRRHQRKYWRSRCRQRWGVMGCWRRCPEAAGRKVGNASSSFVFLLSTLPTEPSDGD